MKFCNPRETSYLCLLFGLPLPSAGVAQAHCESRDASVIFVLGPKVREEVCHLLTLSCCGVHSEMVVFMNLEWGFRSSSKQLWKLNLFCTQNRSKLSKIAETICSSLFFQCFAVRICTLRGEGTVESGCMQPAPGQVRIKP